MLRRHTFKLGIAEPIHGAEAGIEKQPITQR